MYLHSQNHGGLLMDKSVIINGFIHQLFTKNEIVTDAECLDILHTYFKLPLYTIAAFAPDTKNNNGSYQHDVISFIPGYASGCRDCIVWFYRTENHELLLIFNHNEDFNIKNCITGIHNYFSKRYNCRTLWGISRPCGNFSEFIFAKKEALTCLFNTMQEKDLYIMQYDDYVSFTESDSFKHYYPDTAANLLINAVKYNNNPSLEFVMHILFDENVIIRSLDTSEMLKLHHSITASLMTLNPTKNNFQDILLKFSQDMSELQHNQKQYFALLTETCRQISLALNSHRILRKKLPINEVKIYMSDNFSNPNLNLACTARQFDVSEGYLSSCFKKATGICFADHLENIRIKKACELLASSDKTIVEIAEKTGYNSVYSFRRAFKRMMHKSPSDYRGK